MTDRLDELLRQAGRSFTEAEPAVGPRPDDAIRQGTRRRQAQKARTVALIVLLMLAGVTALSRSAEQAEQRVRSGGSGTASSSIAGGGPTSTTTTTTTTSTSTSTTTATTPDSPGDSEHPAGPTGLPSGGADASGNVPPSADDRRDSVNLTSPTTPSSTVVARKPQPVNVREHTADFPYYEHGMCYGGTFQAVDHTIFGDFYGGSDEDAISLIRCASDGSTWAGGTTWTEAELFTGEPLDEIEGVIWLGGMSLGPAVYTEMRPHLGDSDILWIENVSIQDRWIVTTWVGASGPGATSGPRFHVRTRLAGISNGTEYISELLSVEPGAQ